MSRKVPSVPEQNKISEQIIDMLKGMPVQIALSVLDVTRVNMLYLATVTKPEDDLARRQIDIEDVTGSPASILMANEAA